MLAPLEMPTPGERVLDLMRMRIIPTCTMSSGIVGIRARVGSGHAVGLCVLDAGTPCHSTCWHNGHALCCSAVAESGHDGRMFNVGKGLC